MSGYYEPDLAFIHDAGFSDWALKSAPGILDILKRSGIREGLVVDLGCGSGQLAGELVKADYQVLGIDISQAMIALARKRVPDAEFRIGSLFTADLPACDAVTSISECLNYIFDEDGDRQRLTELFGRVYAALIPGGVFVFDIAEPGQAKPGIATRTFTEGDDWVVLAEKTEDPKQSLLTRRIVAFRKAGDLYRRSEEVHLQRLYKAAQIEKDLVRAGFKVKPMRSYGAYRLPPAHTAFVARKPK